MSYIVAFHGLDLVNFCSPCKVMQLSAEFAEVHSQVAHCQAGLPNPPIFPDIFWERFIEKTAAAPHQVQPDLTFEGFGT